MFISVCIATYNGEKYIKEQILSILPQLGDDDEIIISDDGSTDETLKFLESFTDEERERVEALINQIEEEEIINLIKKYTEPHLIPGNKMRYSLFHSLLFIENLVRKPLQEKFDPKKNKKDSTKLFFNEIFKVMKIFENVSAQKISWVKSNKKNLEAQYTMKIRKPRDSYSAALRHSIRRKKSILISGREITVRSISGRSNKSSRKERIFLMHGSI